MNMYEIIVPHNEMFQYWEDDGMLWHVKDPDHTHPKFDTHNNKFKDTLWKWKSGVETDYAYTPLPSTLVSCGFWLIDNNPKEMQAFAKWCVKTMEKEKPCAVWGGKNYILAYRHHGSELEMTYFVHPKTTNRPINWIR